MSSRFFIFMALGLAVIGVVVFLVFSGTKGAHLRLEGEVLKARTGALEDHSAVVLDFRLRNPSDVRFQVREVKITLEKANGARVDGMLVSKVDMQQLFAFNRFLGERYNDALSIRDEIPQHGQIDRMVAATFDVPQSELDAGRAIHLWIQDMDGAEFETVYKPPKV